MFGRLGKGRLALACAVLVALCFGFVTPALADTTTYAPADAKLTKVIVAPDGTDPSSDKFVFRFAGGGEVTEGDAEGQNKDKLFSDGVEQDATTIKVGDVVPTIADVELQGVQLNSNNTLGNGQVVQAVVQKSIAEILADSNAVFPHAGVYTYVVTEKVASLGTSSQDSGVYVNASRAEYVLRIRVGNTKTEAASMPTNRELTVEGVTLEQTKDDNGDPITAEKVDPTYPTTTSTGKIEHTAANQKPADGKLAGDEHRGRDVPGFTFANEYIKGGSFVVKKLYDGSHSDRTKYSTVQLAVYSEAAKNPDAHGACLTYVIEGEGEDLTDNLDEYGDHKRLNGIEQGIPQERHAMAEFSTDGWAIVTANLKEDSLIRVTGEFGPYNPSYAQQSPNGKDRRMTLTKSGLLVGQQYYVIESAPGSYEPTGYVYLGEGTNPDPRTNSTGMTTTQKLATATTNPTPSDPSTLPAGALLVKEDATGAATTVFVVNKIDESSVSPTGIIINNLPYILMATVPLGIFAAMFVAKRRADGEE